MHPAAALLKVALVAVLLGADPTLSQKTLSCPCGSTGVNYTFQISNAEKDCRTWSRCLKCQDEVDYCLECPVGLTGSTCSQRERNIDLNECPDPGVPAYGVRTVIRPLNTPPFTRGSHLKFECVKDFYVEGWNSMVCLTGGKWSSPLPKCLTGGGDITRPQFHTTLQKPADDLLVNCSNPGPHLNGWVRVYKPIYDSENMGIITKPPFIFTPNEAQYPRETRLEYFCFDGYRMQGFVRWYGGFLPRDKLTLQCMGTGLWNEEPVPCLKDCGQLFITKPIEEWPWMVGVASLSNNSSRHDCGGVLLNDRTVLTSASCLLVNEKFELLFGNYGSMSEDNEDGVIKRTTFTVQIHPNFNDRTHTADIALIHFSPSIAYSDDIKVICLPTHETKSTSLVVGRNGYVTSWRFNMDLKAPTPYIISYQTLVPLHTCLKEYERNHLTLPMDPEMFCAQPSKAPSNCTADVVSHMLFFGVRNGHTRYTLEGLASPEHSSSCGRPERSTIFTRVLPYVPWIEENMS